MSIILYSPDIFQKENSFYSKGYFSTFSPFAV